MPNQIEFMDCPHCGKRVRTTAERCHRCGESTSMRMRRTESFEGLGDLPRDRDRSFDGSGVELGIPSESDADNDGDGDRDIVDRANVDKRPRGRQPHHAAPWGGYDSDEDDFDYDEFLEKEFGRSDRATPKPWWWYVAWVVLFVMVVGILVDAIALVYPRPSGTGVPAEQAPKLNGQPN